MAKTKKSQAFQKLPLPKRLRIHIENRQKALPIKKRLIQRIVHHLSDYLKIEREYLSIYFVTEKKISTIHEQFFQDPTSTDCISFPMQPPYLGEIFICPSVAIAYAKTHRIDPFQETILYLIHGILHLIGYDDIDPKDRKIMRKMEKKCINYLYSELTDYP